MFLPVLPDVYDKVGEKIFCTDWVIFKHNHKKVIGWVLHQIDSDTIIVWDDDHNEITLQAKKCRVIRFDVKNPKKFKPLIPSLFFFYHKRR